MTTNIDFVATAEAARVAAVTTLNEVTAEHAAASEAFEAAKASLRSAIGASLIQRNDPTVAANLVAAQDAETKARLAIDRATLTLEAARENLANAEAELQRAKERRASDRIQADANELMSLSAEIDELVYKVTQLIERGTRLELSIASTAQHGLPGTSVNKKWRELTINSVVPFINRAGSDNPSQYGPQAASAAEQFLSWRDRCNMYAPTVPDEALA
ncbi:hypothetical protein JJL56_02315 [Azospirillum sp. YIM DDC1]|uniref:Uncharacterized protein n=1 Tax=Azospirillum aestuarii TaxID=2802052 RepID=A0ABS1HSP6_9PROT|nr:hypothetical protein [Azospirillum aestuarii]MBK4717694.1 hypothetical protein [Azospirillum aestuarii]